MRGGREVVAPSALNRMSATWTASSAQPDAEGHGAGLDQVVERHLQLASAEHAFEHDIPAPHPGQRVGGIVIGSPLTPADLITRAPRCLATTGPASPHGTKRRYPLPTRGSSLSASASRVTSRGRRRAVDK